jgi:hypothetical protein
VCVVVVGVQCVMREMHGVSVCCSELWVFVGSGCECLWVCEGTREDLEGSATPLQAKLARFRQIRCASNMLRPSPGLVTAGESGLHAVHPGTCVGTVPTDTRCLVGA